MANRKKTVIVVVISLLVLVFVMFNFAFVEVHRKDAELSIYRDPVPSSQNIHHLGWDPLEVLEVPQADWTGQRIDYLVEAYSIFDANDFTERFGENYSGELNVICRNLEDGITFKMFRISVKNGLFESYRFLGFVVYD